MRAFPQASWQSLLARGLAMTVLGLASLVWPQAALISVASMMAILTLIFGGALLSLAFLAQGPGRTLLGLEAILALLVGGICLTAPETAWIAILALASLWSLHLGASSLWLAYQLSGPRRWEWALGLFGLGSTAVGLGLVLFPGVGIASLVVGFGVYLLVAGLVSLFAAFRLKGLEADLGEKVVYPGSNRVMWSFTLIR